MYFLRLSLLTFSSFSFCFDFSISYNFFVNSRSFWKMMFLYSWTLSSKSDIFSSYFYSNFSAIASNYSWCFSHCFDNYSFYFLRLFILADIYSINNLWLSFVYKLSSSVSIYEKDDWETLSEQLFYSFTLFCTMQDICKASVSWSASFSNSCSGYRVGCDKATFDFRLSGVKIFPLNSSSNYFYCFSC